MEVEYQAQLKSRLINHIKIKLQSSFLSLWDDILEIYKSPCFSHSEGLKAVEKAVIAQAMDIDGILRADISKRTEQIKDLKELKENISEIFQELCCYISLNEILYEVTNMHHKLKLLAEEKEQKINEQAFFKDCMNFISKGAGEAGQKRRKELLIKHFPLSMTKEQYYNYVLKSLAEVFKNKDEIYLNSVIKLFKLKYFPVGFDFYGKHFEKIRTDLEELCSFDYDGANLSGLEEIHNILEDNMAYLNNLSSYLSLLYDSANNLFLIVNFAPDMDYILDNNIVIKDLYYTAKENAGKESFELYERNYEKDYENQASMLVDMINGDEEEGFLNPENDYAGELGKLLEICSLISEIYYEMLSQNMYPSVPKDSDAPARTELIKAKSQELIDYMESAAKGLSGKTQKMVSRIFLGLLPAIFTDEEFYEYMELCFENAKAEEKLLTIYWANNVFDGEGFIRAYK